MPDDAESVVAELVGHIQWHNFRAWSPVVVPPPEGVIEPCGSCSRPKADHPIPFLRPAWDDAEMLGRMIAAAASIDGPEASDA